MIFPIGNPPKSELNIKFSKKKKEIHYINDIFIFIFNPSFNYFPKIITLDLPQSMLINFHPLYNIFQEINHSEKGSFMLYFDHLSKLISHV